TPRRRPGQWTAGPTRRAPRDAAPVGAATCSDSSCAGLTRASRFDWHGRAMPSEMAGTSPAMTMVGIAFSCPQRRAHGGRVLEQAAGTCSAVAPAEATKRIPQHGLVAGDDRAVEPPFQLIDDREGRNVGAADEVGV